VQKYDLHNMKSIKKDAHELKENPASWSSGGWKKKSYGCPARSTTKVDPQRRKIITIQALKSEHAGP